MITIDTHNLILWARPKKEAKQEQVRKIYEILSVLIEFGEPFLPNYLPAKRKSECKPFILSYENIEKMLEKIPKYEELDERLGVGKAIGFFSSLEDEKSSRISMNIGHSNSRGNNTIVISFPINFDFEQPNISNRLAELLKELVKIFDPYWGCITSWFNSRQFDGYYNHEKGIPNAVFWMNYWGEDITNTLKVSKKIKKGKIDKLYEIEEYHKGYFLRLQEKPIDINNEIEIDFQKQVNSIFNL